MDAIRSTYLTCFSYSTQVAHDVLRIIQGKAPPQLHYVDEEEEWVVDEWGRGAWRPVRTKFND